MPDLRLDGCRPEPLAHYLKALGVLRLVSEQVDSEARGWWAGDVFHLRSQLDYNGLEDFFMNRYAPTPIVAPWNGGSGFYPKDNKVAIDGLAQTVATRFASYRKIIELAKLGLAQLGLREKLEDKDQKGKLLQWCRNHFSDEALGWLDAAYVLTDGGPKYPPLLGTGGNDGRLDFTNNFMMRLVELFDTQSGHGGLHTQGLLKGALLGEAVNGLITRAIGQFFPGAAGGANATTGFDSDSLINPWDFILALEGAIFFASASARRLDTSSRSGLSYPFTVRQVGAGYGSASSSDETDSRAEMWLPLWENPGNLAEIQTLFAEGRGQVDGKTAANGVDFARAIASLGIDRGIQVFYRYGFQVRNGLAYFATSLGRWEVKYRPDVSLLSDPRLARFLDNLRRAGGSNKAPASIVRVVNRINAAILAASREGGAAHITEVLIALGEAEAELARSSKFTQDEHLEPVPALDPRWLEATNDGSIEFRLAVAAASMGIRQHLVPVRVTPYVTWLENMDHPSVVWGEGSLIKNLFRVFQRRLLDWQHEQKSGERTAGLPLAGKITVPLADIGMFLEGALDEERLAKLLRGLALVDWHRVRPSGSVHTDEMPCVTAAYALLKLVHLPEPLQEVLIPYEASIARRAWAGDLARATRLAINRLRGSGFVPMLEVAGGAGLAARRIAAALIFPIGPREVNLLTRQVFKPGTEPISN